MSGELVGIGIIGLGKIGQIHAEAIMNSNNGVTLRATADHKATGLNILPHFANYQDLLSRPDIQAVTVSTPPNTHFQIAMDALNAGKHVLVEKPPTLTREDLQALQEQAQKCGVIIYTAYHARHRPEVVAATRLLQGRTIDSVEISYHEKIIQAVGPKHWMLDPQIAGGGIMMDNAINAISVLREILPNLPPLHVIPEGVKLETPPGSKVEFVAEVPFDFQTGQGFLYADWDQDTRRVFRVDTDKGLYVVNLVKQSILFNRQAVYGQPRPFGLTSEYKVVYGDFVRQIRFGNSLVRTAELDFVLDTYAAAKLHQPNLPNTH